MLQNTEVESRNLTISFLAFVYCNLNFIPFMKTRPDKVFNCMVTSPVCDPSYHWCPLCIFFSASGLCIEEDSPVPSSVHLSLKLGNI